MANKEQKNKSRGKSCDSKLNVTINERWCYCFSVYITHRELRLAERDSHPLHSSVSESPQVSSSPAWAPAQD